MPTNPKRRNSRKQETRKSRGIPQATIPIKDWSRSRSLEATEADVQGQILNYLALRNVLAFHIPNHGKLDEKTGRWNRVDRHHVAGVPDLAILLKDGRVVWAECKRPDGGVLSPAQHHLLGLLTQLGHMAIVVRSVAEIETFLQSRNLI